MTAEYTPDGEVSEPAGDGGDATPTPRTALIAALRRRGDETQLTRVLAALVNAEAGLAAAFVRLVAVHAPRPPDLSSLPADLACRAEEVVGRDRFDLSFRGSGGWHVVVELKIGAGFGPDQIARYSDAVDNAPAGRGFVIALTRDVPTYGEPPVGERWLGSVRWGRVLGGLRALGVVDPPLRQQWLALLDVLEGEGVMGFTQPNRELFDAWLRRSKARDHLARFVETVREPVGDALRDALAESNRTGQAMLVVPRAERVQVEWGSGRVRARFDDAAGKAILEVGVMAQTDIYGYLSLPHLPHAGNAPPEELRPVISALADAGFTYPGSRRRLRATWSFSEPGRLDSTTLPDDFVDWARLRLTAAVAAGAFG